MSQPASPSNLRSNSPAEAGKAAPVGTKGKISAKTLAGNWFGMAGWLRDEVYKRDRVADSKAELARREKLIKLVRWQAITILVLVIALIFASPFLRPIYRYFAILPKDQIGELVPLDMPNMTDQALLSWVANSVTEILTFGFGDIIEKLDAQRTKFTSDGWSSLLEAIGKDQLVQQFRSQQLVLTTVPTDTPLITSRGINEEKQQFWTVELPVVMTYVTNNSVSQQERPIIKLTIVRVPTNENPQGIAIKLWELGRRE